MLESTTTVTSSASITTYPVRERRRATTTTAAATAMHPMEANAIDPEDDETRGKKCRVV
jgi:hypothetical protein